MSQALYRKYRSKSLSEVVGQDHITTTLANSIASGQISHAYLFTGPRGVGKTSIARILAHEINKLPYDGTQHLDIIEIDAASNRKIDDIRDLREKVHIAPTSSRFKVYIIDEVHMLTGESFNALLKTLEEPPAHVVFIMATTESHKLPATIISRTQRYSFKPAQNDKIISHLRNISDQENIKITDEALSIIAEQGDGSFRDSISLLDQLAHINEGNEISADNITAILGLIPKQILSQVSQSVLNRDRTALVTHVNELLASGTTPATVAMQLSKVLADQALETPELFDLIDKLLDVPRAYNPSLKLLTVLASYGVPTIAPQPVAAPIARPVIQRPAAAPKPTVIATATPEPAPAPQIEQPPAPKPVAVLDLAEYWPKALEIVKKQAPLLVATLKQSQPILNGNELTLKFKLGLHHKKVDTIESKNYIIQAFKQITGHDIIVAPIIDKTAVVGALGDSSPETSIAQIMGGGHVIDATNL